jgi:large subunit ribosomal protein L10
MHMPNLRKPQYVKKAAQVQGLHEKASKALSSVVIEYRGMTVKEMTELRNRLRKIGAEMDVAKNTLVKRALEGQNIPGLAPLLEGPTAMVFAYKDSIATVKVLHDFIRESKLLVIKGGAVEGRYYDAAQLHEIARMPARDQIIGTLLGSIQAPAANLVGVIQAPISQLVFTLQAIGEKGQEQQAA